MKYTLVNFQSELNHLLKEYFNDEELDQMNPNSESQKEDSQYQKMQPLGLL